MIFVLVNDDARAGDQSLRPTGLRVLRPAYGAGCVISGVVPGVEFGLAPCVPCCGVASGAGWVVVPPAGAVPVSAGGVAWPVVPVAGWSVVAGGAAVLAVSRLSSAGSQAINASTRPASRMMMIGQLLRLGARQVRR